MGIKPVKHVRVRSTYDPAAFDQYAADLVIPTGAPTHCSLCGAELTPLRRSGGRGTCPTGACEEVGRAARAERLRVIEVPKQGVTTVLADAGPINTSKRGAL